MQQTTYGETPDKVRIYERDSVDSFLESNRTLFLSLKNSDNCMYNEESKTVSDTSLNYLNTDALTDYDNQLKILLKKEFVECENYYTYLGDFFIEKYFSENNFPSENFEYFLFNRSNKEDFIKSLSNKSVKDIARSIFDNASMQYNVSLEKSLLKDIHVEKIDYLNFNLDYDSSFLGNMHSHTMRDYRFIIIDGQVESVGEIHHLLDSAYNTKIPHVIFCFGMSKDVEHVIKYNNTHSKFEVFPVIVEFDEKTINILHDIAVLHQSQIVSSKSGQTISQALREDLPKGRSITLHKEGFKIDPIASEKTIQVHRNFLLKRISESMHVEGKKLLVERLKRFSSKVIKIYIPEKMHSDNDFMRELGYVMSFLKNSRSVFSVVNLNNRVRYLPLSLLKIVNQKIKSVKQIYSEIEKLVINVRI